VIALTSRDEGDENHAVLQDNLARMRSESDAQGRALEVIERSSSRRRGTTLTGACSALLMSISTSPTAQ
jgi:agmatine/peptidylarginine deiminase